MKNEFEFLPVAPFWRKPDSSRRRLQERAFCMGIVVGTGLSVLVSILLSLL